MSVLSSTFGVVTVLVASCAEAGAAVTMANATAPTNSMFQDRTGIGNLTIQTASRVGCGRKPESGAVWVSIRPEERLEGRPTSSATAYRDEPARACRRALETAPPGAPAAGCPGQGAHG